MTRRRTIFLGAAIAALLPASARTQTLPERSLGSADAPVTLVEYASITCKFCQRFHLEVLPELKREFIDSGKVRLVYRHFPLDRIAFQAAILTQCASPLQFFGMLDLLFRTEDRWGHSKDPEVELGRTGLLAGVSLTRYDACKNDKELIDAIIREQTEGQQKHGVDSTPTFVVNGKTHKGIRDFAQLSRILSDAGAR